MVRLIADAGLLIAAEAGDRDAWALKKAMAQGAIADIIVPAPVLAQVWRSTSADLHRFVKGSDIVDLDEQAAKAIGALLGKTGTHDVCDAAVACAARPGDVVATGDPDDITLLLDTLGTSARVRAI